HRDDFDIVVICIGLYSQQPNMPEFPGADSFSGIIMHNSALKSRDQLAGKRVAVLGFGKSATDAALESAAVATETHIIVREPRWPFPQKLAGVLPFKWGLLNRMTSALIPLYQHPTPVERAIHSLLKPLVWFYWRLVTTLLYFQCGLGSRFGTRVSLVPSKPVETDAFSESTMIPRPDFYKYARRGVIDVQRTSIVEYTPDGIRLGNGTEIHIDTMILATGWKADFGFLSQDVWRRLGAEDDGFYLYRHIMNPDVPGLFFIGRASTICSILTYSLQASWLGELVENGFQLPSADAMRENVDEMKAWKRAWIPFSPARSARLIAFMQHYHDELLRDFGASPWRKTGLFAPVKELIFPYEPRDYAKIVSGAWRNKS
ncbi:MAG: NAD(P)-binding domain-containing protein, partial [Rhodospirillales bacterium]|nr:NAD(P)-binding domain-containing protein [Rhodospirillales bacterium]